MFFSSFPFVAVFGLSRRPGARASGKTAACAACLVRCLFWPLSPADRVPARESGQLRAAAPFGGVSRAGRPLVGAFRHSAASFVPRAGDTGCCAVVKVRVGRRRRSWRLLVGRLPCRGACGVCRVACLILSSWSVVVAARGGCSSWSSAVPGLLPLVAAWRVSSSLVVVGRRRGACASLLVRACGGPAAGLVGACRPACAGGPIWLVRGGLRRRGACGGPAAVVRASGAFPPLVRR